MSTFIGQLIGFAVIVFILVKWVVPLVRDMMHKQQDAIRTALAESAEAAKKLEDADAMHAKALEDAEAEVGEGDRRGTTGLRAHRRAAAGAGGHRCRTNQGSGCTAGSVDAPAAHPAASRGLGDGVRAEGSRSGARARRRSGRPGGDRRPLPRRSRRDGAVERGDRDRRIGQAAFRQPAGARRTVGGVRQRRRAAARTADSPRSPTNWPRWSRCSSTEPALEQAPGRAERRPARPRCADRALLSGKVGRPHPGSACGRPFLSAGRPKPTCVDGIEHIARLALLKLARGQR